MTPTTPGPGSGCATTCASRSGSLHGGVISALVESLCSRATALAVLAEGMMAMGQSIDITFLRPTTEGHVEVEARARHRGRTTWVWDAEVHNAAGKLCALARMTVVVRPLAGLSRALSRRKRLVIGRRRSRPNAFGVILIPGGAWRRLYSARSTMRITSSTTSAGQPRGDHLLAALVALDIGLEDPVEHLIGRQRVLVELVGPQLRRGGALDHRARAPARGRPARCGARPARRRASSGRP